MFQKILQLLVPKEKKFYPLFDNAAKNLVNAAEVFNKFVAAPDRAAKQLLLEELNRIEVKGDQIAVETYKEVLASFLTPLDREDIHALITAVDDIVDAIYGSAKRYMLYNLQDMHPCMLTHAKLLDQCAREIDKVMEGLKDMKGLQDVKVACTVIKNCEAESDMSFESSIAEMYDSDHDAKYILKWREVLSYLEKALDYCEDASVVFEGILAKNA